MRVAALFATAAVSICASALLFAQAPTTGNPSAPRWEYKATTRVDIENLGSSSDAKPSNIPSLNTNKLTAGLNQLSEEGWELVLIEPAYTRQLGGEGNPRVNYSPTYILRRSK
jgi:hypothetical protein